MKNFQKKVEKMLRDIERFNKNLIEIENFCKMLKKSKTKEYVANVKKLKIILKKSRNFEKAEKSYKILKKLNKL